MIDIDSRWCAVRSVFPEPNPVVRNGPPVSQSVVRNAVDIGESFVNNVTNFVSASSNSGDCRPTTCSFQITLRTSPVQSGTATATHSRFQKAKPGVARLNRLGLIGSRAHQDILLRTPQEGDFLHDSRRESAVYSKASLSFRQRSSVRRSLQHPLGQLLRPSELRFQQSVQNHRRIVQQSPRAQVTSHTINLGMNPNLTPSSFRFGQLLTPLQRVLRSDYGDRVNSPRASK
jgi:hypothetical protein